MCIIFYEKKRYEDIRYAYGATLAALRGSGEGRVKYTEKKRYVTLERPIIHIGPTSVSFYILSYIVNLQ